MELPSSYSTVIFMHHEGHPACKNYLAVSINNPQEGFYVRPLGTQSNLS